MAWSRDRLPDFELRHAFARFVVAAARCDCGQVFESDGPNDSERIREVLAQVGIGKPAAYCAAIVSAWMRDAAELVHGIHGPPFQSPGAKALLSLGEQLGLRAKEPTFGALAIWDRSTPGRTETQWRGHVEVVSAAPRDGAGKIVWWSTIGGNVADPRRPREPRREGVHETERTVDELVSDKRMLGFIDFAKEL